MPERPATWEDVIRHEAKGARVPPELALAIADTESGFNPDAVSPKGARGLFQLMPDTAAELGVDPNDPVSNIRGGLKYFRQQLDQHGGNVEKALQSYNWGPGNVAKGGEPPEETRNYVTRILGRLGQSASPTPAPGSIAVPAVTQKDMIQRVGQPPPGGPPTRERSREVAAEPPPGGGSILAELGAGLDPRTRTGRRSLAGGVGGVAGGAATGALLGSSVGPVGTALGVVGGAMAGAGLFGAGAEAAEQMIGTPPPEGSSVMAEPPSILGAGAEQAGYELLGHVFAWPVRAIGKRVLASPVTRQASKHFDELLTGAKDALTSARNVASEALATATEAGAALKESASERASRLIAGVRTGGRESIRQATELGEEKVSQAAGKYDRIATAPPTVTPRVAGQRAIDVIKGPAKDARSEIGQMVEEAAKSGPDVDITPLKAEAQRILQEEIRPPLEAFPRPGMPGKELSPAEQTIAELQPLLANFTPERVAGLQGAQRVQYEAMQKAMDEAREAAAQDVLKHPAMQVLGRIISADDTVPFQSAHLFKRELDDAIGTAWDKSVRNRVTNITKVMRGTLRDQLSGHAPYDMATQAYASIAPLYTKGIAPKLLRVAEESPEAIVSLIRPDDPTKVSMLKDLLVGQGEAGGAAGKGQYAWDSVRSAWTHRKLIRGGLKGIDDRIAKMDPEFADVMYGDGPGQMVLNNLKSISAAYKSALERAAAGVAETKDVARGAMTAAQTAGRGIKQEASKIARAQTRDVRREGRELVQGKITDLASARGEARKFSLSSLVRADKTDALVDVLRAGVQGPGTLFGGISTMRLLRGVKDDELVKYAAYSNEGTKLLVDILTSPAPQASIGALVRLLGGALGMGDVIESGIGTPPPAEEIEESAPAVAGLVGAPPP